MLTESKMVEFKMAAMSELMKLRLKKFWGVKMGSPREQVSTGLCDRQLQLGVPHVDGAGTGRSHLCCGW